MMTPRNMTTTEFLAFAVAAPRANTPKLMVRAYDFSIRKWQQTNDQVLIAAAMEAAKPRMGREMSSGDTLYIGDIDGCRVMVEVW